MNPQTFHASIVFAVVWGVVIVIVMVMMLRGWHRRGYNQRKILGYFPVPPALGAYGVDHCVEGMYLGSTIAPEWNNRVVVDDLGYPAHGRLVRYSHGILVERMGEEYPLWIPQESILTIRLESGIDGRVISFPSHDGVVVIRWVLPSGVQLDTGFCARNRAEYTHLLEGQA